MTPLINGFLIVFLVDGILSMANDLAPGLVFLGGCRHFIAAATVLWAMLIYLLLALTPRFPKRILMPPVLFLAFASFFYGMPLPLYLGFKWTTVILDGLQILVGVLALVLVRYTTVSRRWFLAESALRGPQFRLSHTLLFIGGNLLILLPAAVLYSALCLSKIASHFTAGFVNLGFHGIRMEEREYVRGDKSIRLVPMAHIGNEKFYQKVSDSFQGERTIVLMEGVTDTNLLLRSFSKTSYQKLASTLGLQAQDNRQLAKKANTRQADVDASRFSPRTVEVLNAIGEVFQKRKPREVMEAYLRYISLMSGQPGQPVDWNLIEALHNDLIQVRNRCCLEHVRAALPEYDRIIIPWGAGHMPGLEQGILAQGFAVSNTCSRVVIKW